MESEKQQVNIYGDILEEFKMRVLELFAGTRSIGKAFERVGHEVYTIEIDPSFENISWYEDIMKVTAKDILERFGQPDVIWASPPCQSYSVSAIYYHLSCSLSPYIFYQHLNQSMVYPASNISHSGFLLYNYMRLSSEKAIAKLNFAFASLKNHLCETSKHILNQQDYS